MFALLLLVSASRELSAATCPSWTVGGTVSSGDDSIIPGGVYLWATGCHPDCLAAYAFGDAKSFSLTLSGGVTGNFETQFYAASGSYFTSLIGGSMKCTMDLQSGCTTCSGGFGLKLYATQGAIEGRVEMIPRPRAGLAGIPVWMYSTSGASGSTFTNASGHFEWRSTTEPARSNNWGVSVDGKYSPWPHSGEGSSLYRVGVGPASAPAAFADVTVRSSKLETVNLNVKNPYVEEPDMRYCPSVGRPVSVVAGNAFFDQSDIALPGLVGLTFTRAYNSKNAFRNVPAAFSRGWTHSYERTISVPEAGALAFRGGDGVPIYYQDNDGDSTYEAVLPATEKSWIVRESGGEYTRHLRQGGYETYDSLGRLSTIVDASGNTVTLTRNGAGRLETIADPGGRSLTLTYNASSRIESLSGPGGVLATYGYDDAGDLHAVTYPDGSGYVFTYDDTGQVLRVDDQGGTPIESHTYDGSGYAMTSEIADGRERLDLGYDNALGATTVSDALGHVTTYQWKTIAALRRVTEVTGACPSCGTGGTIGAWEYDDTGNMTGYTDGAGNRWTYTYDPASGDRIADSTPRPPRGQDSSTSLYTYFPDGRLQTRTDPLGGVTSYTYGPAGPLTVTESVTTDLSRTTTLTYTPEGKLETIQDPRKMTTRLGYNSFGDVTSVTNPLTKTTSFDYDPLGRRASVTDPLRHTTTTTYGDGVHVTRITNHDLTHTDFTYDLGGRRTSVTNPMGRVTQFGYDGYGRLATVTTKPSATEPPSGVTTYDYDLMSNLTSITDARGKVTSFTYDDFNRLATVRYPGRLRQRESFTYDAAGRLATRTDRKRVVTSYEYDVRGRLIGKTYSDGTPAVTFSYDKVNRLLSATDSTDSLSWTYDLAGQVLSEASKRNASAVTYTYDPGGNRRTLSLDGSLFLDYGYDDASQLRTITRGEAIFNLDYDDASRRTSLTYPNTISTNYSYDDLNRLTRVQAGHPPLAITDFRYVYDDAGNRTRKEQLDYTEDYSYDPLDRLTGVLRTHGLTGTWQFTYDAAGNRITNEVDGLLSTSAYGDRNELLSTSGATSAAYSYDANGNLQSRAEGKDDWTYEWNAENQLTRVTKNSVEQARFAYDPMGRRVERVAGGVTTSYVYDSVDILREQSSSGTWKYIHTPDDDDHVAAEDGAGVLSFYHLDGLRSVVRTTDSSGAVTLTRQYDAFGKLQVGAATNGFSFTGREWDSQTRLYYYRARYYSANDGRFISEDPIGFGGGINFYAYVLNSPPNYLDPSGREVQVCCAKAEILGGLVDHCWIKTDAYEAGLGVAGQPACQNAPMPGEPGGGGVMTQVVDHSACGAKRNPVCTPVTNVCEACVDDSIKVGPGGLGKPMGLWTPANNCQTFVKAALTSCSTRKNRSRWFTLGGRLSCGGD